MTDIHSRSTSTTIRTTAAWALTVFGDSDRIVQDRQGFMWFGTWLGGLSRYDGYTFKIYKHNDQDDRSLGSDSIWGLRSDCSGPAGIHVVWHLAGRLEPL